VLERARRVEGRPRSQDERAVASLVARDLLEKCKPAPDNCEAPNGKFVIWRGSDNTSRMLWLPWATLASIALTTDPPEPPSTGTTEDWQETSGTLVRKLSSFGGMDVTFRFQPAEYLFAISETLCLLRA
jgi:hypothetical protein